MPRSSCPGVELIWRQDCYQLPTGRTSFGFKDGIGQPAIEGSGIPATNPMEQPIKPGSSFSATRTRPAIAAADANPVVLGRNGTYIVFRKLHTRVAAFRRYLREKAKTREEEALLGAKMVGRWKAAHRWRSPPRDDPDSARTTRETTPSSTAMISGVQVPGGCHARRANPRDAFDDEVASTFDCIA